MEVRKTKLSKDKIALLRARKSMSVSDMAKAYGVSHSRMAYILNSRDVTPVCAGRVATALGVDVTEILED